MNMKRIIRVICLCLTFLASMVFTVSAVACTNDDTSSDMSTSFFIDKVRYYNGGKEMSYSERPAMRLSRSRLMVPRW